MCGIAGVRRFGPTPITRDQIELLFYGIEARGTDAAGIAILNGNEVSVCKSGDTAWKFLASSEFDGYIQEKLTPETEVVLLHTRFATQGSTYDNKNNHPLFSGDTAVIHNGTIYNDDYLFKDLGFNREAETDSDILRGILDKDGLTRQGMSTLNRVNGSCAMAAISSSYPGYLLLARSGSPLVIAGNENEDQLVFASTKAAIVLASKPWTKCFGIDMQENKSNYKFRTMNGDSAWLFGPKGLEWRTEFKSVYNYKAPTYSTVHSGWQERQGRMNSKKSEQLTSFKEQLVECSSCGEKNTIPFSLMSRSLDTLFCFFCNETLRQPTDDESLKDPRMEIVN